MKKVLLGTAGIAVVAVVAGAIAAVVKKNKK
ncbi:hypothetical protein ABID00_004374 [Faecalicatena orotica]